MTGTRMLKGAIFVLSVMLAACDPFAAGEDNNAFGHVQHPTFYQQVAVDIHGNEVEMAQFKGQVVLIVNVASECGYTDSNYRWLNKLHGRYVGRGLTILLFPCNQFGGQEPGSKMEVQNFIGQQQIDKAMVFEKVNVKGPSATPLYEFLHDRTGSEPTWNFAKYLIDQTGDHVRHYATTEDLEAVEDMIGHLLLSRRNNRTEEL